MLKTLKKSILYCLLFLFSFSVKASFILIPMDEATQQNHLKAYGITYWALDKQYKASWLLNYRGGSFSMPQIPTLEAECRIRGVSYEVLPDVRYEQILLEIADPEVNMDVVKLEKTPKIAVYSPKNKTEIERLSKLLPAPSYINSAKAPSTGL